METTVAPALLKKKFYPVIHCIDPFRQGGIGHALTNTRDAIENGADGVFLIGHGMPFSQLTYLYDYVRKEFPDIWIGINFLDLGSRENWIGLETVTKGCVNLNALWIDQMPPYRLALPKKVQIFGGVAFKYISAGLTGIALNKACTEAMQRADVVTTSGDKTGCAPSVEKIHSIKKRLAPVTPLAIASGITVENVTDFIPHADIFLVASSISTRKPATHPLAEYLVPEKVLALTDAIHKDNN